MKYNVLQFSTSTSGYYAGVVATFDGFDNAKVKYHQLLAALINDADTITAVIKIEDQYGHEMVGYMETVEHSVETETETETI